MISLFHHFLLAGVLLLPQAAAAPVARFLGARSVAVVGEHLDGTPFKIPQGIFYDAAHDEIFIADTGNGMIGIFDGAGVPRFSFATGPAVRYPTAVAVDAEGDIYALEPGARAIAVFDYRGAPRRQIVLGEVDGVRVVPSGMDLGRDGRLYVLDGGGGRIVVYATDGKLIRVIRGTGPGGSRLQAPYDIAFDAEGNLYVSDRKGIPVQIYDPGGRFIRGFGKRDIGVQDFAVPSGISVDEDGAVIIVDPMRQEIKIFDRDGEFQERFGGLGAEPGAVAYPTDVATGPDGRVFVIERVGRRLQIFQRISLTGGPNGAREERPSGTHRKSEP